MILHTKQIGRRANDFFDRPRPGVPLAAVDDDDRHRDLAGLPERGGARVVRQRERRALHQAGQLMGRCLGFGRIVASEIEAPNILVNLI